MDGRTSIESRIAYLVHSHFDGLPPRSKPVVRPDGTREWVPMAGIVVVRDENTPTENLTCVAVTTGAKCLSASQIPLCKGLVLHDSHAEILAMRAFNYWLLSECRSMIATEQSQEPTSPNTSPYIRRRRRTHTTTSTTFTEDSKWPPFELHPDLKVYMYCTCAPCGDASMELCMQVQEDATPWEIPPPRGPEEAKVELESPCLLDGRAHFSRLGVVRRKPARMDAEPTWSKSCSDKLALRQVSSLLSYETSLVVAPTENAYLAGLILPEREVSRRGCERAFGVSGRMAELNGRFWPDGGGDEEVYGYRFRPFRVLSIPDKMARDLRAFGKPDPVRDLDDSGKKCKPSNVSAIWARAASGTDSERVGNGIKTLPSLRGTQTGLYETIVNGVRQGSRASSPVLRGASVLSRAKLWGLLREVYMDSGIASVEEDDEVRRRVLEATTYNEFKKVLLEKDSIGARSDAIQDARKALKGWIRNSGDEGWGLEVSVDAKKRKVDNFLV